MVAASSSNDARRKAASSAAAASMSAASARSSPSSSAAASASSTPSSSSSPPLVSSSSSSSSSASSSRSSFSASPSPSWEWGKRPKSNGYSETSVWHGFSVKLCKGQIVSHDVALCNTCKREYKWGNTTTGLADHLVAMHPTISLAKTIAAKRKTRKAVADSAQQLLLTHGMSAADAASAVASKRVRSTAVLTDVLQPQALTQSTNDAEKYAFAQCMWPCAHSSA